MSIFDINFADITKEDEMSIFTLSPQGLSGQAAQAMPSKPPPEGLEVGMEMLKRLEPDLTPLPMEIMVCSIAVSLRNISDKLSALVNVTEQNNFKQSYNLKAIKDAIDSSNTRIEGKLQNISEAAFKLINIKVSVLEEELKKLRGY